MIYKIKTMTVLQIYLNEKKKNIYIGMYGLKNVCWLWNKTCQPENLFSLKLIITPQWMTKKPILSIIIMVSNEWGNFNFKNTNKLWEIGIRLYLPLCETWMQMLRDNLAGKTRRISKILLFSSLVIACTFKRATASELFS